MFPNRFFAPRFFAKRYFPSGIGVPVPPVPIVSGFGSGGQRYRRTIELVDDEELLIILATMDLT